MSLSDVTRRKWWSTYETFNTELDKLSSKELNFILKSKIAEADSHVANNEVHTTKEEKAKWNSFKGYPLATTVSDGLISQEEKDKLNAIADNANNYSHPLYNGSALRNTYMYKVSNEGHITDVLETRYLPITVNNVYFFGGLDYSKFLPTSTTSFFRLSSPDVNVNDANNIEKMVNVKTVKEYAIDSAVSLGTTWPSSHKKIFYNQNNKTLYYYDDKDQSWKSIISLAAANMITLNADGKIDKSLIHQNSMPLGHIITINSRTGLNNRKYRLCDGSVISRSDYPELFALIDNGSIYTISYADYLNMYTTERNTGTKYKSCYAFVRTQDNAPDSIILPKIHMTNIRAQTYINSDANTFYKESTRNISGEFPVFNFYDKTTNTMMKYNTSNDANSAIKTAEAESYVQSPFDKWSAYKRDDATKHIKYGGSYYSFPYAFKEENSPQYNYITNAVADGYMDSLKEKNQVYQYDNSTLYNTDDENCPACTYVSAYVRVRE